MTEQEINCAIAEAIGWKRDSSSDTAWFDPSGKWFHRIPNFHASLDACAIFEETLNDKERILYAECLAYVTQAGPLDDMAEAFEFGTAKPRKRCIAFLRVKGIWREQV